jgi:hypothetical protein
MNEPVLPEDMSRWPSDPHELLGVERGVAPKDLKRVYTRLIKVWKPEHYPEHFRRIREAYEAVLRYVEYFGRFEVVASPEAPPDDSPEPEVEPIHRPLSRLKPRPEPQIDPPAERIVEPAEKDVEPLIDPPAARIVDVDPEPIVDPPAARIVDSTYREAPPAFKPRLDMAALWERAIQGEEAEAYRGLKRLYEERPQQTTVALRLYWLLSLDPSIDPELQPSEWLIAGLRNGGLHGPCMELYRREIEADPEEAFSERFERLLKLDAPTPALAEILSWRWAAVRQTRRWETLDSDLDLARDRIARTDEGAWLRLLLCACDGAAWIWEGDTYSEFWELLQREIQQLQHLATRHGEWFDRFDFLVGVRRDWQRLRKSSFKSSGFLDLIAKSWHAPYHTFQAELIDMLGAMIDHPRKWLDTLDRVVEVGPHVLPTFAELLRQMEVRQEDPPPKPDETVLKYLATTFIRGLTHYGSDFRHRVVAFCFREGIDPAWIIEPVLTHDVGWYSPADPQRFVQIMEDWPVRYLCQAHRLFWTGG